MHIKLKFGKNCLAANETRLSEAMGRIFAKTHVYIDNLGGWFSRTVGVASFSMGNLAEIMHLYFVGVIKNIAHEGSMGGKKDASLGPA